MYSPTSWLGTVRRAELRLTADRRLGWTARSRRGTVAAASMAESETHDTHGTADGHPREDPPGLWRLRSRGCWTEAAELLTADSASDPDAALRRAALLTERSLFTAS